MPAPSTPQRLSSPLPFALGTVLAPLLETAERRDTTLLLWLLSGSILGYTWQYFGLLLALRSGITLGDAWGSLGDTGDQVRCQGRWGDLKGKHPRFLLTLVRGDWNTWAQVLSRPMAESPGSESWRAGLGAPLPRPSSCFVLTRSASFQALGTEPGVPVGGRKMLPTLSPRQPAPPRPNRHCFRTLLGASSTLSCLSPPRQVPAPARASSLLRVTSGRPTAEEEERGRGGLGGNATSIQPL